MRLFVKVCVCCAFVPDNVANSMSLLLALRISSFFSVSSSARQQMISPLWKKQKPINYQNQEILKMLLYKIYSFFSILNSIYKKKESRLSKGRRFVPTVIYSFTSEVIKDGEINPNPSAPNTVQKHIYLVHNQKCSEWAHNSFYPMSKSFPYTFLQSARQHWGEGGGGAFWPVLGGGRPASCLHAEPSLSAAPQLDLKVSVIKHQA